MTRKQRATRQSVPAKAQRTDYAPASGEARRKNRRAETDDDAGIQRPTASTTRHSATWKLEEAKAKFSEVVRRAHDQGPQYVTVRGKKAVAIIDAAELERLLPASTEVVPLVEFLEGLYVEGLDLMRERDLGREAAL